VACWCALLGALGLSAASLAGAQDFGLDWSGIAAGGGASSGGEFALNATVGEPDPGALAGGDFSLQGGFWSAIEPPSPPTLSMRLLGDGLVLSWPVTAGTTVTEFDLQAAPELGDPSNDALWSTLTVRPELNDGVVTVHLPLPPANQFYRLRQP